jgi:CubicO group peptidase (beta-lactamase class C family)
MVVVGASASPAPPPAGLEAAIDALFEPVRGKDLPGAAVVVAQRGEVVYAKAHGLASVELDVANTLRTRLRLASVTKSFTALAVLQLVEQGRLGLDDPLAKYVPDFRGGDRISLRHLLSHTSGIPDFVGFDEAKSRPQEFAPGERLNYSNTGYVALGRVLAAVTGKSYEEHLRAAIFEPLGLTDTGCDRREAVLKHRAAGYLFAPELVNAAYSDTSADPAAGGLYSTAEDMLRWAQALQSGRIVAASTRDAAFTPVSLAGGRQGAYGFGFMVTRYKGLREVGHGGDISGFNAYVALYPEAQLAVVVLSNVGMWAPGPLPKAMDVAHRIVDVVAADRLGPEHPAEVALSAAALDRCVGRYRVEAPPPVVAVMGDTLEIARDGERLVATGKQGRVEIFAQSETSFFSKAAPMRIEFRPAAAQGVPDAILTLMELREFSMTRLP